MKDEMFYDAMSGRYFMSSVSRIDAAARELALRAQGMTVTLNDFYAELANDQLPAIPLGDEVAFHLDYIYPRMTEVHDDATWKLLYVVLDWEYRPCVRWNIGI